MHAVDIAVKFYQEYILLSLGSTERENHFILRSTMTSLDTFNFTSFVRLRFEPISLLNLFELAFISISQH